MSERAVSSEVPNRVSGRMEYGVPGMAELGELERPALHQMVDSAMSFAVEAGFDEAQWFVNFLGRVVARNEAAHEIERSKPEVNAALMTVFPGNQLIRPEDYDQPGRKWPNAPVSRFVGNAYLPELCSEKEAGMFALRAEMAVEQWYEFMSGAPLGDHPAGWQESNLDWKHITKRLQQPQSVMFNNFARLVDVKLDAQEEPYATTEKRDIIQTQQELLPLALVRIAYRAYLQGDPDKEASFVEHFTHSIGDFESRNDYLRVLPFASIEARQAFIAASDAFSEWCLMGSDKKRHKFYDELVSQSMAMNLVSNLQSGSGLGIQVGSLYRAAQEFTESAIIGADIEDPAIIEKFRAFTDKFEVDMKARLNKHSTSAETAAAIRKVMQPIMAKRTEFLLQLDGMLMARGLLYGLADEKFGVTELTRLAGLAAEKPIAELRERVQETEEMFKLWEVEWQIAPPHKGLRSPQETTEQNTVPAPRDREADVEIDLTEGDTRLDWLKTYMKMWDRGRSVLVRSKIPDLEHQYHIALLSEELPNGDMIWHGIADNVDDDAIGEHAVLVWRAEAGYDEYGRRKYSWDKVYQLHKDEMKIMGLLRMLHTDSLPARLVETVFYQPSESIAPYREENYAKMLELQAQKANRGYNKKKSDKVSA